MTYLKNSTRYEIVNQTTRERHNAETEAAAKAQADQMALDHRGVSFKVYDREDPAYEIYEAQELEILETAITLYVP